MSKIIQLKKRFVWSVGVILFTISVFSQGTTKNRTFSGAITATNNGISLLPTFSLGKPAAIFDFSIKSKRWSFDPQLRFSLEGKPWSFIYWFRYKVAKTAKYSLNIGAHPSIVFRNISVMINGNNEEIQRAQRFVAGEISQNYRFNKHVNLGFYYLVSPGSIENKTKPTNLITLRSGYNNIELGKEFVAGINSQLIYLFSNGEEGSYVNATITLAHKKSPVTLSYFYNKPINSSITGGKEPVWNVGATYAFNKMFKSK